MNLSLRLTEVKNMVVPCDTVCDVGCDHGYVSIALIKEGKAKKVLACDVNEGPLMAAKVNITEEGLSDKIETRLSDGLHNVTEEDHPDAIVIAGMGGALMERILSEGKPLLKTASQLVLQPQSEVFLVRKWLRENGYNIVSEKMLIDMGKYYCIINAQKGDCRVVSEEIQRIYDVYSGYLIESKDPVLKEYLEKALITNNGYLEGISVDKRGSLLKKIQDIKKALLLMEK